MNGRRRVRREKAGNNSVAHKVVSNESSERDLGHNVQLRKTLTEIETKERVLQGGKQGEALTLSL